MKDFLDRAKPDIVLIEGPSDLTPLIEALRSSQVRYPAAILAYTEASPVRTVLYPLADHSPELAAMRWAWSHNVPVEFCDLPSEASLYHAMEEKSKELDESENSDEKQQPSVYALLEKTTGQDDDIFWEYNFEQAESLDELQKAVREYGRSLR